MKENILYITDTNLYLYNYKKKQKFSFKIPAKIIKNGRIVNYKEFIKSFSNIATKISLNQALFGEKIRIIVSPAYHNIDLIVLKNIFNYLNFKKIKIDYEVKYYKLDNKNIWFNLQEKYLIVGYLNEYKITEFFLVENNLFKNDRDLYRYLKYIAKNRDIFLIGNEKKVGAFYKIFERLYQNKTYMFNNCEYYLIDKVLKIN